MGGWGEKDMLNWVINVNVGLFAKNVVLVSTMLKVIGVLDRKSNSTSYHHDTHVNTGI